MTFDLWVRHHNNHLQDLYRVFWGACVDNNVDWNLKVSFLEFCEYVYENSNKELNPWI